MLRMYVISPGKYERFLKKGKTMPAQAANRAKGENSLKTI